MRFLCPQSGFNLQLGGGRYDYEILSALARQGHEVHTAMSRSRGDDLVPPDCSVRWTRWRAVRWGWTWNVAMLAPPLGAIRATHPDVIRVPSARELGLLALILRRLTDIPLVGVWLHLEPLNALQHGITKAVLSRF